MEQLRVPAGGQSRRVLLVEDDRDVRRTTRAGLEHLGWCVDEADGCETAFGQLADGMTAYCAVVVDLGLPDGDGTTVVRHVTRTRPGTAVIVASGSRADHLPQSVAVVPKPYTPTALADTILRAVDAAGPSAR